MLQKHKSNSIASFLDPCHPSIHPSIQLMDKHTYIFAEQLQSDPSLASLESAVTLMNVHACMHACCWTDWLLFPRAGYQGEKRKWNVFPETSLPAAAEMKICHFLLTFVIASGPLLLLQCHGGESLRSTTGCECGKGDEGKDDFDSR